ncbi:hypothetical protein NL676_012451 [Syzygium grande]|nr:hypothetical protein NL676_012451 [Syzygium grande]
MEGLSPQDLDLAAQTKVSKQEGDLEELERTAEPPWSTLVEPFREDCRSMDGSPGDDRSSPCRKCTEMSLS